MDAMEREAIRLGALIRAAEDWSSEYAKDAKTHSRLLRFESKWELDLRRFFNDIADSSQLFVNWGLYQGQVRADYNVEVIVNDEQIDVIGDQPFIKVSLETVTEIAAVGAQAGQAIYSMPLGISSTDANIQKLGIDQVASLVGKKVKSDGTIINNPNSAYNITKTMRNDIAQSIKTSLTLGEDVQTAISRVRKTISNAARAEKIARTESVNAYQAGLRLFAIESGALGKEWQSSGAIDKCAEYSGLGPVPINYSFGGVMAPTAHVNCRCGIRYIYPSEWGRLNISE